MFWECSVWGDKGAGSCGVWMGLGWGILGFEGGIDLNVPCSYFRCFQLSLYLVVDLKEPCSSLQCFQLPCRPSWFKSTFLFLV